MGRTAAGMLPQTASRVIAKTRFAEIAESRIAIIDDDPLNVRLIRRQMELLGFQSVLGLSDPL